MTDSRPFSVKATVLFASTLKSSITSTPVAVYVTASAQAPSELPPLPTDISLQHFDDALGVSQARSKSSSPFAEPPITSTYSPSASDSPLRISPSHLSSRSGSPCSALPPSSTSSPSNVSSRNNSQSTTPTARSFAQQQLAMIFEQSTLPRRLPSAFPSARWGGPSHSHRQKPLPSTQDLSLLPPTSLSSTRNLSPKSKQESLTLSHES